MEGPELTYDQGTGVFTLGGKKIATGYAGHNEGKNNPALEHVRGTGPLPRGTYILTSVRDSKNTGPYTIVLEPVAGNVMFGRSEFRIHGDSIARPGTASNGCIILPRSIRERIWNSGGRRLVVK